MCSLFDFRFLFCSQTVNTYILFIFLSFCFILFFSPFSLYLIHLHTYSVIKSTHRLKGSENRNYLKCWRDLKVYQAGYFHLKIWKPDKWWAKGYATTSWQKWCWNFPIPWQRLSSFYLSFVDLPQHLVEDMRGAQLILADLHCLESA